MTIVGQATQYLELLHVLNQRRAALGFSHQELEQVAGLTSGYLGKIYTNPTKPNARTLGRVSLGLVLEALGLKLLVVEDPTVRPRRGTRIGPHTVPKAVSRPAPQEAA